MTTLREAAQQALEAMESDTMLFSAWTGKMIAARTALRAALAQQAEPLINQCGETCERAKLCAVCASKLAEPVEPVAWAEDIINDLHALHDTELIREVDSGDALIRLDAAIAAVEEAEQRHTSLPQRLPLTDEEMESMWEADTTSAEDCQSLYYFKVVARVVEQAHGIKE